MKTYINPITTAINVSLYLMQSVTMSSGGVLSGTQDVMIPKENWGAR